MVSSCPRAPTSRRGCVGVGTAHCFGKTALRLAVVVEEAVGLSRHVVRARAVVGRDDFGIPPQLHEESGRVVVAHGYAANVVSGPDGEDRRNRHQGSDGHYITGIAHSALGQLSWRRLGLGRQRAVGDGAVELGLEFCDAFELHVEFVPHLFDDRFQPGETLGVRFLRR